MEQIQKKPLSGVAKIRARHYQRKKKIAFSPELMKVLRRADVARKEDKEEHDARLRFSAILSDKMTLLQWRHDMICEALMLIGRKNNVALSKKIDVFIAEAYSNTPLFKLLETWLVDRDTEALVRSADQFID